MNEFLSRLDKEVERVLGGEVGVVLSGGLDSSLLLQLAREHTNVVAYSVGVENAPDLPFARIVSEGLEHRVITITESEVLKELPRMLPVIRSIEGELSPVRVGAELPAYFAAMKASEDGVKTLLSGQGPDEMFGGYARYIPLLLNRGYEVLEKLLEQDTLDLKTRLVRIDRAVCALHGIDLQTPFLNDNFIEYGLSIPVERRLWLGDTAPPYPHEKHNNKYIIRKFCEKLAALEVLPKEIVWRPKKAAQYGSGIHKLLERLAKKAGYKEKARGEGRQHYLSMFLEDILEGRVGL